MTGRIARPLIEATTATGSHTWAFKDSEGAPLRAPNAGASGESDGTLGAVQRGTADCGVRETAADNDAVAFARNKTRGVEYAILPGCLGEPSAFVPQQWTRGNSDKNRVTPSRAASEVQFLPQATTIFAGLNLVMYLFKW